MTAHGGGTRRGLALGTALAFSAAFFLAGASLVACFDIFHSTGDVLTACERDASTPGCGASDRAASTPADTDFCAWTPQAALEHATHACAWLGACETPSGGNAFGPCMFDALLAFDCAANPDHRSRGSVHATWDCLQQATTCDAVDACVFGTAKVPSCAEGPDSACLGPTSGVRVSCDGADGGRGHGENCALWGKTCAKIGAEVACGGPVANLDAGGLGCGGPKSRRCDADGTIHWCSDPAASDLTSVDVGFACSGNGAGKCNGYPPATSPHPSAWAACVTNDLDAGNAGANACTPTLAATCEGDLAVSCPTGVRETLDCRALLGTSGACVAGDLDPPFDWTRPCVVRPSGANAVAADGGADDGEAGGANDGADAAATGGSDDADGAASSPDDGGGDAGPESGAADGGGPGSSAGVSCAAGAGEGCAGDTLTSCARGAPFTVNCRAAGLGPCRLASAMEAHAACTAPPTPAPPPPPPTPLSPARP